MNTDYNPVYFNDVMNDSYIYSNPSDNWYWNLTLDKLKELANLNIVDKEDNGSTVTYKLKNFILITCYFSGA